MRFFSSRFANSNAKLSRSNSLASEFKTSMIEIKKSTLKIEINLWNELSMSSSTSKQLQNNIVDLFCSQQKLLTSANRKTQYMFSSLDALMLNSHANVHNNKNTTFAICKKWQWQILVLLMINISNIHLISCFRFASLLAETYS